MYRIPATMFATGFVIPPSPGRAYAANVDGIVCIRPCDGWPARAFESVRLMAFGFPPDSRMISVLSGPAHDAGTPVNVISPSKSFRPAPTAMSRIVPPPGTSANAASIGPLMNLAGFVTAPTRSLPTSMSPPNAYPGRLPECMACSTGRYRAVLSAGMMNSPVATAASMLSRDEATPGIRPPAANPPISPTDDLTPNADATLLKPRIIGLMTWFTTNVTGTLATSLIRFHCASTADTPALNAGATMSRMNPPSAPNTGLMTLFHTAEMYAAMPPNTGSTTLCHSHVNSGARTVTTYRRIAAKMTWMTVHATLMANRIPANAGSTTLCHRNMTTGATKFSM